MANPNLQNDEPWTAEPFGCDIAGHEHRNAQEAIACPANRRPMRPNRPNRPDPASYLNRPYPLPPEFEPDIPQVIPELVFATRADLASIINLAIRVGRGTATIRELTERLAPYGVRRKV